MRCDAPVPRHVCTPSCFPARPLRVLQVVDSLDPGGAERHVVDLALELAHRGHQVEVATSVGGLLAEELKDGGVQVRPLLRALVKRRVSPEFAARLRALVTACDYDIVHAHIFASAVAAAVATADGRCPLVVTEHTEAPWRPESARRISGWMYRRAQYLVAVSQVIRELLCDQFGIPADRVRVLPPAITPSNVPPAQRPCHWRDRTLIGRVCRLQPEKGVDVFLRAAALVRHRLSDAHFVVVGDGPLRGELEALANRLGVGADVELLGFRRDARALIGAFDLLAVTSRSDGTPLVVFEALSAGVPVVGSAVGGIPDQIRHGREGLLVPPDDPAALADAFVRATDPSLAARLRDSARRRAARFSHAGMVDEVEDIYRSALSRPVRCAG